MIIQKLVFFIKKSRKNTPIVSKSYLNIGLRVKKSQVWEWKDGGRNIHGQSIMYTYICAKS